MKQTKTRKLIDLLKHELLENLGDNQENALKEIIRYKENFPRELDYNIYSYGNIRPYYSQIREFFDSVPMKVSGNDEIMCNRYKYFIRKAVKELIAENFVVNIPGYFRDCKYDY